MPLTPERRELLLKQYDTYVDLFKFYVETAYKFTAWFFVITGAILSYQMKERPGPPLSVLVPIAFGLLLSGIFLVGSFQANEMKRELKRFETNLDCSAPPTLTS